MKTDFDKKKERRGSACFKYDALKMVYGRDDLMPLWVADMDFEVASEIKEAMQERLDHGVFGYNLRPDSYYEAIINWCEKRYNWQTKRDWILSPPGVVPALNLAIMVYTQPGDGILIQTPVYAPFHLSVQNHKRQLLESPLCYENGRWEIDFEDFEAKASQARFFILCNPHNPVGRVYSRGELLEMGRICKKHNLIVFSDEIHADIVYDGHQHVSFSSLEDFGSFTITGFSPAKSFNIAGLATAVCMVPNQSLRAPLAELVENLHLYMGNSFGIVALETAYTKGEAWLEELKVYLRGNRDYIDLYLKQRLHMLKAALPEGTYLTWVDFGSMGLKHEELKDLLWDKAKLALDPGIKYGEQFRSWQRINFGCPKANIETALDALETAIRENVRV